MCAERDASRSLWAARAMSYSGHDEKLLGIPRSSLVTLFMHMAFSCVCFWERRFCFSSPYPYHYFYFCFLLCRVFFFLSFLLHAYYHYYYHTSSTPSFFFIFFSVSFHFLVISKTHILLLWLPSAAQSSEDAKVFQE